MLLTRRKGAGNIFEIQTPHAVNSLKYLGIILDSKLTFRDHISTMIDKCSKLIFVVSKSAKLNWGLNYAALKITYTGSILLLLYGVPVCLNAINKASYKLKITRVQRLINTRLARAYRTVSNEALCLNTGLTPQT